MKSVIFDQDGTLLDTFPGIMKSANDVAEMLGYGRVEDRERFFPFTGLPLSVGFPTVYGMEGEDAEKAPRMFMQRYVEDGCLHYDYYPGVYEAVRRLHDSGLILGVSTLKTEDAARKMLDSSSYSGLFSSIRGNTPSDDAEKSLLIRDVLSDIGSTPAESVFVGDTSGDMMGAAKAGVMFIGVGWGFGSAGLSNYSPVSSDAVEMEAEIVKRTRA